METLSQQNPAENPNEETRKEQEALASEIMVEAEKKMSAARENQAKRLEEMGKRGWIYETKIDTPESTQTNPKHTTKLFGEIEGRTIEVTEPGVGGKDSYHAIITVRDSAGGNAESIELSGNKAEELFKKYADVALSAYQLKQWEKEIPDQRKEDLIVGPLL